jgi:hypothetical protein
MKQVVFLFTFVLLILNSFDAQAQQRRSGVKIKPKTSITEPQEGNKAVVIDDRLSVLLAEPSLFARPIQRMRTGRNVVILGEKKADGVSFYQISAPPIRTGWVQAEAVINTFRKGEDIRIVQLIQATEGFEKIQRMKIFLDTFPESNLRPAVLLLMGDILEELAVKVSKDAGRKLDRREMAASGAPLHSFYLSYNSLDRYRKLGIGFLFNVDTKTIHYDGAGWKEIIENFPKSSESPEAQKRVIELTNKMKETSQK